MRTPSRWRRLSAEVPGVEVITPAFFNEFTIKTPKASGAVIDALADRGIIGGVPALPPVAQRDRAREPDRRRGDRSHNPK